MQIGDTTKGAPFFDVRNDAAGAKIYETLMRSDPVDGILKAITSMVPATDWVYAGIDADGTLSGIRSADGADRAATPLLLEYTMQRATAKFGPRIAATRVPLGDCESGVTLLFADAKTDFGILVLVRSPESGLFRSAEVEMLALALDAASDRLAELRFHLEGHATGCSPGELRVERLVPEQGAGVMYVLDHDYAIVLARESGDVGSAVSTGLRTRNDVRLPGVLEETVRRLAASWDDGSTAAPGIAYLPFLSIHATPLAGPIGRHIGVRIDRFRPSRSLSEAVRRFNISARETQVLTLLLDGRRLAEIGSALHITSSTVQDHIRNMVIKTESRNRSELIARVFGWEFAPGPR